MGAKWVDYSTMEAWVASSAIADAAQAIREDSASVASATANIGPAWRDLRAFFITSSMQMEPFFGAGDMVTEYGEHVQSGGNNIAKVMEDCAQAVKTLEGKRPGIIERADKINAWVSTGPNSNYAEMPVDKECSMEEYWAGYYAGEYQQVMADMNGANKSYAEAIQEMAERIKSLDDDGSTANPWIDPILDAVIIGGTVIGIFITPVGTAVTALEIARYYAGEYQQRERELLEEYPEMYDHEITWDATKTAVVNGSILVLKDKVAELVGGEIVKKLAEGTPLNEVEKGIVAEATEQVGGLAIDLYVGDTASTVPHVGSTAPIGSDPTAPPQTLDEAMHNITIKDYDGDGYTDPEFLPSSDEVRAGFLEPADEVRVPSVLDQLIDPVVNAVTGATIGQAAGEGLGVVPAQDPPKVPIVLEPPAELPPVLAAPVQAGPPAPAVSGPPAPTRYGPPAPAPVDPALPGSL